MLQDGFSYFVARTPRGDLFVGHLPERASWYLYLQKETQCTPLAPFATTAAAQLFWEAMMEMQKIPLDATVTLIKSVVAIVPGTTGAGYLPCVVCDGKGKVPLKGVFIRREGESDFHPTSFTEPCEACEGKGKTFQYGSADAAIAFLAAQLQVLQAELEDHIGESIDA